MTDDSFENAILDFANRLETFFENRSAEEGVQLTLSPLDEFSRIMTRRLAEVRRAGSQFTVCASEEEEVDAIFKLTGSNDDTKLLSIWIPLSEGYMEYAWNTYMKWLSGEDEAGIVHEVLSRR